MFAIVFPPPLTVVVLIGAQLVIVGTAVVLLDAWIAARFPGSAAYLALLRTAAIVVGVTMIASGVFGDTTPDSSLANPVAPTVRSVTVGADLYQANCAACHGVEGRGGGPMAGTTPVRPADLRSGHLATHTDGDLFYWVSTGMPGGMPAWADRLSETERWNIVNFLRSLNAQGPAPAGSDPSSSSSTSFGVRP
jgi:mono/diheme cytochrome c family protein